jgi:FkbM family methyltransferase
MSIYNLEIEYLDKWGYRGQKFIIDQLKIYYRPETTDVKVITEVLTKYAYQKKSVGFLIEQSDVWLDLGANIGTFSLFVLSVGGEVIAVEPEQNNLEILEKNLMENFSSKHTILPIGVDIKSSKKDFYLCKGDYNKYRHSLFYKKGREKITIPIIGIRELLKKHPSINAIKMDIEGAEIEILELLNKEDYKNINKLVFEYTFDVDRSIPRFMNIINKLKSIFEIVHFTGVKPDEKEYNYYPPCTIVYCLN